MTAELLVYNSVKHFAIFSRDVSVFRGHSVSMQSLKRQKRWIVKAFLKSVKCNIFNLHYALLHTADNCGSYCFRYFHRDNICDVNRCVVTLEGAH